jgi:hypothetical protein
MKPIVLFRRIFNGYEQTELDTAKKYFEVTETRVGHTNRLVIPRYSAYPFYKELEYDIEIQNSKLINSISQWFYIANFSYYLDVQEFTPKTYFDLESVPKDDSQSFVVKGRTKSRKEDWDTLMFAKGYKAAAEMTCKLMKDDAIARQGVIIREYVPLKTLEIGINGMPFSNEWRFFYHGNTRLCHHFYWSAMTEKTGHIDQAAIDFADMLATRLSPNTNFFVIDIAEKAEGGWIMIEANCGTSSGLRDEACDDLYRNLAKVLALQ